MALRRPLYIDSNNDLRSMDETHLDQLRTQAVRNFALNDFYTLAYESAGGGGLETLSDTRLQAGASTTDPFNFDTEGQTPEPSTVTVNYDFIFENAVSSSTSAFGANGFPLYWDGTNVQSMSEQDFIDTIITPAVDRLVSGSLAESDGGGTFFVSTLLDDPLGTRVSGSPIFTDTRADSSAYTAGGIGETRDQPQDIQSYYLYEVPPPPVQNFPKPVYGTEDGNIRVYDKSDFDDRITRFIGEQANISTLAYSFDSSGAPGSNMGSAIVNTRLSGTTGLYTTRFVNTNDYRTQEFPFGVPETQWTNYLKLRKTT